MCRDAPLYPCADHVIGNRRYHPFGEISKMPGQTITCRNCGNKFIWTEREQSFYAKNNFSPPKRCPACLKKSKAFSAQPEGRFIAVLALAVAVPVVLIAAGYWLTPWIPLVWLLLVNIIAFNQYGADKALSQRSGTDGAHTRISESRLFTLVALGGTLGAVRGRHHFRHKTRKGSFRLLFWLIVLLQLAAVTVGFFWLSV
jgi:uncharacterized membrane protein YsdA (DUF1294 family)